MNRQEILLNAIDKTIGNGWGNGKVAREFVSGVWRDKDARIFAIIYDHGFAQALWGDDMFSHLQRMVIAEDPIMYLGENTPQ